MLFVSVTLLAGAALRAQVKLAPAVFLDSLASSKNSILLDVRTPEEYAKGSLAAAQPIDWNDKNTFYEKTAKLNPSAPVYLFCQSGGRSAKASQYLQQQGFTVYELEGGFKQLPEQKRPISDTAAAKQNVSLSLAEYQQLTRSHPTVLINFTADWCAPCQAIKPKIEKIAQDEQLGVKVIYIDTGKNKALVKALDVRLIPYFEIYRDGKLIWDRSGRITEKKIRKVLQSN